MATIGYSFTELVKRVASYIAKTDELDSDVTDLSKKVSDNTYGINNLDSRVTYIDNTGTGKDSIEGSHTVGYQAGRVPSFDVKFSKAGVIMLDIWVTGHAPYGGYFSHSITVKADGVGVASALAWSMEYDNRRSGISMYCPIILTGSIYDTSTITVDYGGTNVEDAAYNYRWVAF